MRAASERPLHRGGDAALRAWLTFRALVLRLDGVPAVWVVAPLVVVQWVAIAVVALHTPHNGWLYHSGGDSTEYWTHEWSLSRLILPYAALGYAVPVAYAWVPLVFGVNPLAGLPAIVLVQVLLLTPLTVAGVHAVARRLAGRVFAAWAALVWAVAPVLAVPLWRSDYHDRYLDSFLPQLYGLVNLGDFPSLVVLVVAGWLALRTIDEGGGNDALLTGLVLGLAVGVKPANALALPAAFVAFVAARRWRSLALSLAGLLPAVLTLALWKHRALGTLPLFGASGAREAAGAGPTVVADVADYVHWSLSHLRYNLGQLREFFWSRLLCEFLVVAGSFALLRKSVPKGLYVIVWFAAFYLVKGGSPQADLRSGTFLRLTMPGLPAFLLLASAVVLLVPGWGRRVPEIRAPERWPRPTWRLAAVVGIAAVLPLVLVGVARTSPPETYARLPGTTIDMPISSVLRPALTRIRDGVRVRWRPVDGNGAHVFYMVFRSPAEAETCVYTGTPANLCILDMTFLGRTDLTHLDDTPLPGRYQYRVVMAASFRPTDADFGDGSLVGPAAQFRVVCTSEKCRRDVARLQGR
jgi:hypothetical protein